MRKSQHRDSDPLPRVFKTYDNGMYIEEDVMGYRVYINNRGSSLDGHYTSPMFAEKAVEGLIVDERMAKQWREENPHRTGGRKKKEEIAETNV